MKVDESGQNGLSGYKWMKVDENGGKTMENGCKWMKVDRKWMKMVGSIVGKSDFDYGILILGSIFPNFPEYFS